MFSRVSYSIVTFRSVPIDRFRKQYIFLELCIFNRVIKINTINIHHRYIQWCIGKYFYGTLVGKIEEEVILPPLSTIILHLQIYKFS